MMNHPAKRNDLTHKFSAICAGNMTDGVIQPEKVIEGSKVTVKCNEGFRTEGSWILTCVNGTLRHKSSEGHPKCVPTRKG